MGGAILRIMLRISFTIIAIFLYLILNMRTTGLLIQTIDLLRSPHCNET